MLQRIAIFRDVDIAKLKLIAMAGSRLHYAAGEVILRQGDPAEMVYVIMEGEAEVTRDTGSSKLTLAKVGSGALVGEIGVVLQQPYSATITVLTDVIALQVDKSTFLELLQQVPQLSMALIRELSRRLVRASDLYAKAIS